MVSYKRALTVEDLTKLEVFSDPQYTPDGQAYSFVSTTINQDQNYQSQLFIQNLKDKRLKQWTFDGGKAFHPRFSPDGSLLVFQSTRSGQPQLWLARTDGGEAQQITYFKNGATNPEWSKDGRSILFSADLEQGADVTNQHEQSKSEREEDEKVAAQKPIVINRLKYKADGSGFRTEKRTHIVQYHLENKSFVQLTSGDRDHNFQDISPDGKVVLFSANLDEEEDYSLTEDLFTLNLSNKEIAKLTSGKGSYNSATFSPNGDKIACFGHEYAYKSATQNQVIVIDIATNKTLSLSKSIDMQAGNAMIGDTLMGESTTGPVWSKNGEKLYFIASDYGATGLYQLDLTGEISTLYKDNNHVFGFSYHADNDSFIIGISTPTNPCNFYQLQDGKLTRLTNANTKMLDEVSFVEPETITVEAEDGWEIQGWLLHPYDFKEDKKYPLILEIHGGPHAMYGQTYFHELQLLAAKGYAVLYMNPRGSHGYGQDFVNACREDYGNKDYMDLMSAVDYALEKYPFIDENRLGVTGGSYGGFMTNWIVSHTNRFKAAVTQRSISNWLSFYGVSDIGYFFTDWELGHNLLDNPEKLWNFSPLKYAEKVETPLLIIHGEQDLRCPIEQAEQLFVTLKHLKKEVQFVRFPGASHELSRSGEPHMRLARLNHICDWFKKYL